ncbi:hypothetical protein M409DRAFT_57814 [Zasmidium cellare ATCC 36951]|uniref:Uncharacterized protein n=1 Tax=Zasmidium cellare ATCC 36951 TaxID=1080233 RepID=A0A6A6CAA0_ZASCE|nr:uncharacterized protein M409DRAFT_57814 [Zasmidium cellare ATCC 36951]KAF2163150.1 hypothetical protein M409DRAFT_57814 [Zasmidium cellare ATCC 36951]
MPQCRRMTITASGWPGTSVNTKRCNGKRWVRKGKNLVLLICLGARVKEHGTGTGKWDMESGWRESILETWGLGTLGFVSSRRGAEACIDSSFSRWYTTIRAEQLLFRATACSNRSRKEFQFFHGRHGTESERHVRRRTDEEVRPNAAVSWWCSAVAYSASWARCTPENAAGQTSVRELRDAERPPSKQEARRKTYSECGIYSSNPSNTARRSIIIKQQQKAVYEKKRVCHCH